MSLSKNNKIQVIGLKNHQFYGLETTPRKKGAQKTFLLLLFSSKQNRKLRITTEKSQILSMALKGKLIYAVHLKLKKAFFLIWIENKLQCTIEDIN